MVANNSLIYSQGYIISSKDYSKTSSIVTIFTTKYIKTAIVKGARTKQKMNSCNHGNLVNFCHFGREGGLGVFAIEPICNPLITNIQNQTNMLVVFAACELILNLCGEFLHHHESIYNLFDLLMQELCKKDTRREIVFRIFEKLEFLVINPNKELILKYNNDNKLNLISLYNLLLNELKTLDICKTKFAARSQLHLATINC